MVVANAAIKIVVELIVNAESPVVNATNLLESDRGQISVFDNAFRADSDFDYFYEF